MEVFRLTPAASRNTAEDFSAALRVSPQRSRVISGHIAGSNRIDIDAMGREFVAHQPGQTHHGALSGSIGRNANAALEREQRGDVDDLASAPLFDHLFGCGLAQEEDRALVDLDDFVPVPLAEFQQRRAADDAGVVQEDINAAQFLDGGVNNALHTGAFEQIR